MFSHISSLILFFSFPSTRDWYTILLFSCSFLNHTLALFLLVPTPSLVRASHISTFIPWLPLWSQSTPLLSLQIAYWFKKFFRYFFILFFLFHSWNLSLPFYYSYASLVFISIALAGISRTVSIPFPSSLFFEFSFPKLIHNTGEYFKSEVVGEINFIQ